MSRLRDPGFVTASWLVAIVAVVVVGTALFSAEVPMLVVMPISVLGTLAAWYLHLRLIDPAFRIEVCLRPFGQIRF